jgi:hypothetical protein
MENRLEKVRVKRDDALWEGESLNLAEFRSVVDSECIGKFAEPTSQACSMPPCNEFNNWKIKKTQGRTPCKV